MMPLQGDNRVIVRRGLRVLNDEDPEVKMNLGIRKLIQTCNFTGKLDSYSIGFGIGPRINAVGRLGDSNAITDLFLTTNEFKADRMAEIVHQINEIRKNMVASLESHADELGRAAMDEGPKCDRPCIGEIRRGSQRRYYRHCCRSDHAKVSSSDGTDCTRQGERQGIMPVLWSSRYVPGPGGVF